MHPLSPPWCTRGAHLEATATCHEEGGWGRRALFTPLLRQLGQAEVPECQHPRVPSFQSALRTGALVRLRREDNPFFPGHRHLDFHRNLDTFSGLTGTLCLVNPCNETTPCGFKVSQTEQSKQDVCQLWGAPSPRDLQKKKKQEGGVCRLQVPTFSTAE